jgi:predicted HAD superfamily Cof-like phosphohydrolase
MNFITRIADWNGERYPQAFDKQLTTTILAEELGELASAKSEVEVLDALVDLTYIAVGGMWKLGLSSEQVREAIEAVCTSNETKEVVPTEPNVKANLFKGEDYVGPEVELKNILDRRA